MFVHQPYTKGTRPWRSQRVGGLTSTIACLSSVTFPLLSFCSLPRKDKKAIHCFISPPKNTTGCLFLQCLIHKYAWNRFPCQDCFFFFPLTYQITLWTNPIQLADKHPHLPEEIISNLPTQRMTVLELSCLLWSSIHPSMCPYIHFFPYLQHFGSAGGLFGRMFWKYYITVDERKWFSNVS